MFWLFPFSNYRYNDYYFPRYSPYYNYYPYYNYNRFPFYGFGGGYYNRGWNRGWNWNRNRRWW